MTSTRRTESDSSTHMMTLRLEPADEDAGSLDRGDRRWEATPKDLRSRVRYCIDWGVGLRNVAVMQINNRGYRQFDQFLRLRGRSSSQRHVHDGARALFIFTYVAAGGYVLLKKVLIQTFHSQVLDRIFTIHAGLV